MTKRTSVDKVFLDSNVVLYLLEETTAKALRVQEIAKRNDIISVQVLNENYNVCLHKLQVPSQNFENHFEFLVNDFSIAVLSISTSQSALEIHRKYKYRFFDSLILATAFEQEYTIINSEDLHHNQIIEDKLRIINPFKDIQ